MNKAEELREIFVDLPKDVSERLVEQFMYHAKIVLHKARIFDDLINKPVLGISIPYRHNIIRLNEMQCFYRERENNEKYEKVVVFTPEIRYPAEENEELKKVFSCSVKPNPVDKNDKGYILSKKLVEEGFKVNYIFYKEVGRNWIISSIEVFF